MLTNPTTVYLQTSIFHMIDTMILAQGVQFASTSWFAISARLPSYREAYKIAIEIIVDI